MNKKEKVVEEKKKVEAPAPKPKTKSPNIIETDKKAKDGQTKCPKCGATDISFNEKKGKLVCHFCRHEFDSQKTEGIIEDIKNMKGIHIGVGAKGIDKSAKDIITLKCSSCGAEVVIDTKEAPHSRCHWCRNSLSINKAIPNGAIPDIILPFGIKKEDAKTAIETFVGKRKFFAHPKFKEEFTTNNIMGVYLPYMVVDINGHSTLEGKGEVLIRKYTVTTGSGDNKRTETRYDADLYSIKREFDIEIHDLTIESNIDKLDHKNSNKTTNIINSIMPFDIENAVAWDANYLKGFTSEKRDVDIEHIQGIVASQARDVAKFKANETLEKFNRGVKWDKEEMLINGEQWIAAYLPVWLYSYHQLKGEKSVLHYVAVNARTKETMGSVPINMPKLFIVSGIIELLSGFSMIFIDLEYDFLILSLGIIYFIYIYNRYRNKSARHTYEKETKSKMHNTVGNENLIKRLHGLSNSRMYGANNETVSKGSSASNYIEAIKKETTKE